MKVCRECNQQKPLSDFYKHKRMLDGHLNKCVACVKARVSRYRAANLNKVREYDRQRNRLPHRVQAVQTYAQTESGKQVKKLAQQRYRTRYPIKYAAHVITSNAIRDGLLVKATVCSTCNSTSNIEGHHDDYTKPLQVRWLCKRCHENWHQSNEAIYE